MWKVITQGVMLMTSCHHGVMLMMSFILPLAVPPKRSSKKIIIQRRKTEILHSETLENAQVCTL